MNKYIKKIKEVRSENKSFLINFNKHLLKKIIKDLRSNLFKLNSINDLSKLERGNLLNKLKGDLIIIKNRDNLLFESEYKDLFLEIKSLL